MYIKEITLDGFKSYAQQTVVSNFDPHFNAITGLNGSGKSNILDSICFVLGISNLAQVRATNLQELIYKGGNAGITRATVSITFDNMDKSQSPPGYHDYEEITITRQISTGNKHKYLINGQNATAQRVSDLFCSVQLNVNNPNFLIMQGKITKVLNMKPVEILSMIEEAAGTKMYDMKKANALQTIEKKNAKLNEIERVLREDITPQIEKLKLERAAYVEFQKCDREYLHLHKIAIAHQYWDTECAAKKSETDARDHEARLGANAKRLGEIAETCERLRREIKEYTDGLKGKKGQADQNAQELSALEEQLKSTRMEIAKLNSQVKNINKSMDQERKRENEIAKNIKESKQSIVSKEKKLDDMKSNVDKLETELKTAQLELEKAQKEYEALCCGFVIDEDSSQAQTLQDQLLTVRNKISDKKTFIKKSQLKLDNGLKELEKLRKELANDTNTYKEREATFQKEKEAYEKMKSHMDTLGFDPAKLEALNLDRRTLNAELRTLNDKIQDIFNRFPQFNLDYKDPEPNFDRSRIKGLVCNLFRIKDPKYATALETAAGGKLFNVVVDTDQTGKLILERGELKRKVTIIPMNQIRAHTISDKAVQAARKLVGAENVHPAIDLVEYDPQYRPVMEYVFGSRLVCTSLEGAKQVAFNPNVMASTITLDGDHFDPEGILSGGSRGERTQLLMKTAELKEHIMARSQKIESLRRLDAEIAQNNENSQKFGEMKAKLDAQSNALNLARLNLEQTSEHQKKERKENLEKETETLKTELSAAQEELVGLEKKLADVQEKIRNRENNDVEAEKKTAQKRIQEAKSRLEAKQSSSSQLQKEYKSIKIELAAVDTEINSYNEELAKIKQTLAGYEEELVEINKQLATKKEEEDSVTEKLTVVREVINERNRVLDSKNKEVDKLEKEKNSLELANKELEHKKNSLSENLDNLLQKLDHIIDTNEWIKEEKASFNKPNTVYDFQKQNMRELSHRLNELKHRKEKLCKNVDMRAMANLTKKEDEYEELTKRRQTVLKDRSTLESTIEDLEKVKTEVLIKAYESINRDLGNIFKTLLPGAFAKLDYVNKHSLLDGVEFKVAFGDVWKESLTELSGGQRSLVALSLILSLLLYKPAPLYILDEVDAALDTSHTQNIGLMIKRYFKHSQFIIVSLKDGMFTNANVLFKTRLVDGVSTVSRYDTVQNKKKAAEATAASNSVRADSTRLSLVDQTNK